MDEIIKEYPSNGRIKTLFSFDTEYTADSVEWCPTEPFQNHFVCANYQLSEAEGDTPPKRLGRILLFSICPDKGLKLHQTIDTDGVLDQKWCHNRVKGSSLLGVANAKKKVEVYRLNEELGQLELSASCEISDEYPETLILSLDWSTGKFDSEQPDIVCSDSNGNIHRLRFSENMLSVVQTWHAHSYEAWIAAFYYWDTNIVFTGGDDCLLQKFDQRVGTEPIAKNRNADAGVTCVHSNAKQENIIVTGSYDTCLRLWDMRRMKAPLRERKMPGTLWRLKWNPSDGNLILAACMLGGVHVVKTEDLELLSSYYEHKNISYGADWSYLNMSEANGFNFNGDKIIATCSFYDCLLCVAKVDA